MKIIFSLLKLIKAGQKILVINLTRIGTSYVQVLYLYCTKIRTSHGQALVSKDKHYKTLINNTNRAKLDKGKQEFSFFNFFIKFSKKWKMSNRNKFFGAKVFQTEKAVGQNRNKLGITISTKTATAFFS